MYLVPQSPVWSKGIWSQLLEKLFKRTRWHRSESDQTLETRLLSQLGKFTARHWIKNNSSQRLKLLCRNSYLEASHRKSNRLTGNRKFKPPKILTLLINLFIFIKAQLIVLQWVNPGNFLNQDMPLTEISSYCCNRVAKQ